jgi:hypothetical protein
MRKVQLTHQPVSFSTQASFGRSLRLVCCEPKCLEEDLGSRKWQWRDTKIPLTLDEYLKKEIAYFKEGQRDVGPFHVLLSR